MARVLLILQGVFAEACKMLELPVLADLSGGGFAIPPEAILYAMVVTLYAFVGRPRSCLINTFAFTFYWGFIYLMSRTTEAGIDGNVMLVYVASGAVLFVLVNIASFREGRKKQNGFDQARALPAGQS